MSDPLKPMMESILDSLEKIYMHQRGRGFAHVKPRVLNEEVLARLERKGQGIPEEFIAWWREHRSCDISPRAAWNCQCYREEFLDRMMVKRIVASKTPLTSVELPLDR